MKALTKSTTDRIESMTKTIIPGTNGLSMITGVKI